MCYPWHRWAAVLSILQDHLPSATQNNKKQLEVAVQFLISVNKQLHNRRRSSSNDSSGSMQQGQQLQQNVAARVIQLLEAFGATAAAANVAAAAGLDWAQTLCNAAGTHASWRDGSLQTFTQGNRCSANLDAAAVASLASDSSHGASSRQLGPGATSSDGGLEQSADGVGLGPCQQQHRSGHMTTQQPPAQPVDGVKCAEEDSSAVSSPRRHAHAVRHDQQRRGAGTAAAGNGGSHSDVGIGLANAARSLLHHQQQLGLLQQTPHAAAQQLVPVMQNCQQQPGQLQHAASSGQQQQSWQIHVLSQLSSACAAVPVPQQQGPCFRLQQLMEYAGALCQAAVPAFVLLHSSQVAFVGETISTVSQQLQGIVQLMGWISGALASTPHQQQAPEQGSLVANLQGQVLQLGQQLVQLCCLLLSDRDACNRVSGQLTEHALSFVTDGICYLLLQNQHRAELGSVGWQFQGVLQQLLSLL